MEITNIAKLTLPAPKITDSNTTVPEVPEFLTGWLEVSMVFRVSVTTNITQPNIKSSIS